jgi:hypothetical protein
LSTMEMSSNCLTMCTFSSALNSHSLRSLQHNNSHEEVLSPRKRLELSWTLGTTPICIMYRWLCSTTLSITHFVTSFQLSQCLVLTLIRVGGFWCGLLITHARF